MLLNSILEWVILVLFLFVALKVGSRVERPFIQCGYWIVIALMFNLLVYLMFGGEISEAWFSGYILEYTLSIDNLFIFQLMFKMYKTPESQIDKALQYGIGAAALMRLFFFLIGTSLFEWVSWIKYPLGVLLMFTAWKTAMAKQHVIERDVSGAVSEPEVPKLGEYFGRFFPISQHYDKEGKFFQFEHILENRVGENSKLRLTMLGSVVMALVFVDVVFALDAVAAKVTQTGDVYVNFSSSLFAMVSFRSLYHIIAELTAAFALLKYGIAVILAYVGVELFVSNWVVIPNKISCIVIISACTISILGSLVYAKYNGTTSLEMTNFGLEEETDSSCINPN